MSLLAWAFVGFIAGFIASKIGKRTARGLIRDILFGVAGAVIGGSLFMILGMERATAAAVGVAILLAAYQAVARDAR